jgi:hypothetical protein
MLPNLFMITDSLSSIRFDFFLIFFIYGAIEAGTPATVPATAAETKQVGVVTKAVSDVNMTDRRKLLFGAESSSSCLRQEQ